MRELLGNWKNAQPKAMPALCPYCVNARCDMVVRLDEALAALSRARIAERKRETIACLHALLECRLILADLGRDVDPLQPFPDVLEAVFRVGVQRIDAAMRNFEHHALDLVQRDLDDLLAGFRTVCRSPSRGQPWLSPF